MNSASPTPPGWTVIKAEVIAEKITKGASPLWQGFEYASEGVLFVTSENVRDGYLDISVPKYVESSFAEKHANSIVRSGDILINLVGASIGRSCRVEVPDFAANINQAVCLFRPGKNCDGEFMNYYFQSPVAVSKLVNSQSDSARANISLGDIRNLTICLPPLPEQKAIAAAISKWDRGLRQLSELIAAKVHFKQGLIQQLLTGMRRFRAFANRVHEQVRLHDVLEKVADSVAPIANEMYREIGIRSHGKGIFHKEPVSGELLGNKRVYRVVAGCLTLNIVFAWERSLAVTTERESGMIASHRFPMFRPDPKRTLAEYVLLHLLSQKGSEALGLASPGGAGRNRTLSQTVFLKTPISLPPLDEQRQIVDFVQAADHEIDLLKKQLAALKEQKKGLMQKLLTGEVRVKLPKGVA